MLISLDIVRADHQQCCCLEIWDLMRVVSVEQCHLPCAVEFERCGTNRFVIGGFVPLYSRYFAWNGDVAVVFRSDHEELVMDLSRNLFY